MPITINYAKFHANQRRSSLIDLTFGVEVFNFNLLFNLFKLNFEMNSFFAINQFSSKNRWAIPGANHQQIPTSLSHIQIWTNPLRTENTSTAGCFIGQTQQQHLNTFLTLIAIYCCRSILFSSVVSISLF